MSTLEGARLYHAGQLEGLHTHIPVFLARGPEQPVDHELLAFHERLLAAVAGSGLHDGEWQLCACDGLARQPHRRARWSRGAGARTTCATSSS